MGGYRLVLGVFALSTAACGGEEHRVLKKMAAVSVGPNHTCARLETGELACWGNNSSGQLGNGTTVDALLPVPVQGISNAVALSANGDSASAVLLDGTVRCWGVRYSSVSGVVRSSSVPAPVDGIGSAELISAGDLNHTCVVETGGIVRCWGANQFGQLGNGTTSDAIEPVAVSNLTGALAVSANGFHTCVLIADGHVRCWGDGTDGVAGGTGRNFVTVPMEVNGLDDAVAISVGTFHACAVRAAGSVVCWGRNYEHELGTNLADDVSPSPVTVEGVSHAVSLASGEQHTCAVDSDGTVWCWGGNTSGELGSGTHSESALASPVHGLEAAESVSAGTGSTCALLRDHTVRCWGRNTFGALGNGTTQDSLSPVHVLER
jgi:alpha-tubulin suppressor-like RCC1 family protein